MTSTTPIVRAVTAPSGTRHAVARPAPLDHLFSMVRTSCGRMVKASVYDQREDGQTVDCRACVRHFVHHGPAVAEGQQHAHATFTEHDDRGRATVAVLTEYGR